ncbi:MAG TPA: CerR family C-terminal domain-containing protein [Kiritimatiellia bacterium]|nr:CerR family C-terminal domain-containing protein [Kiritimatiellia bacterium]
MTFKDQTDILIICLSGDGVMSKKTQRKKSAKTQENTQDRILYAATKVFAEHGFRAATTRMICAEAKVNVALVNYYFRSKAELYKAVIASMFEDTGKPLMSLPDTVHDQESWKKAMRMWICRSLAICAASKPPELWLSRLMGMEECVPSDLTQDIEEKFAKPVRQCFARLLRMAMKEDDPAEVNLWASSVNAQCVIYALTKRGWLARFCLPEMDTRDWLDKVGEHICAGIFARLSFQRKVD